MPFRAGLHWSVPPSVLATNAVRLANDAEISLAEFAAQLAAQMERYAKENAPWADQTGEARRTLTATVEQAKSGAWRVMLGHGVPYGIFLEVKHAGRWGIVLQTLGTAAPFWRGFLRQMGF